MPAIAELAAWGFNDGKGEREGANGAEEKDLRCRDLQRAAA
jgi:hypothetical protein